MLVIWCMLHLLPVVFHVPLQFPVLYKTKYTREPPVESHVGWVLSNRAFQNVRNQGVELYGSRFDILSEQTTKRFDLWHVVCPQPFICTPVYTII